MITEKHLTFSDRSDSLDPEKAKSSTVSAAVEIKDLSHLSRRDLGMSNNGGESYLDGA